jgi:hypothetical protein
VGGIVLDGLSIPLSTFMNPPLLPHKMLVYNVLQVWTAVGRYKIKEAGAAVAVSDALKREFSPQIVSLGFIV